MDIGSDRYWYNYREVDPETGVEVLLMEDLVIEADTIESPHGDRILRIIDISVYGYGSKEHIAVSLFRVKTGSARALAERIRACLMADEEFYQHVLKRTARPCWEEV